MAIDQRVKDAIVSDVISQALELVDQDQWPGLYSNLGYAQDVLSGRRTSVEDWVWPAGHTRGE